MKILIVEDEKPAARSLERMLHEILGNKITAIKIQNTFVASECFILDNPIDLLLLDLNLDGEDGFELLKHAVASSFQTIIVSANHEEAMRAFEYGVLDFVPKPLVKSRLERALNRLGDNLEEKKHAARYLSVRRDETLLLLEIENIIYFQGADNYVQIYLKDGVQEKCRKTLDSLQKILPEKFMRIHKSFLVNLESIRGIHTVPGPRHEAELENGATLPVSRNCYRQLKQGPFNDN